MLSSLASVTVTSFPRLHLGLLDLGHATHRKYGGAGIVLDLPTSRVVARISEVNEFRGLELLDNTAQEEFTAAIGRLQQVHRIPAVYVEILGCATQHVGLGSKTALLLAGIAAAAEAHDHKLLREEVQVLSGRGGVSGIGIHGFFEGGLLVDCGHPQDYLPHSPSGALHMSSPPMLGARYDVDSAWSFYLLMPKGRAYSGSAEVALFREQTPIPPDEVGRAMALLYHGVAPAIRSGNIRLLRDALREFQNVGFKRREVACQSDHVREVMGALSKLDRCAVGMSSVGPLVYVVSNQRRVEVEPIVREICAQLSVELIGVCGARNRGYVIEKD